MRMNHRIFANHGVAEDRDRRAASGTLGVCDIPADDIVGYELI